MCRLVKHTHAFVSVIVADDDDKKKNEFVVMIQKKKRSQTIKIDGMSNFDMCEENK